MNRMWEYRPLLTLLLTSRAELQEQVRGPEACSDEYKLVRQFLEGTGHSGAVGSRGHERPREASWKRTLGLISRTETG